SYHSHFLFEPRHTQQKSSLFPYTTLFRSKRLYQTATPRIYGESAKKKADEKSVIIADMADEKIYGEEFYRIGFGDAIRKGILTRSEEHTSELQSRFDLVCRLLLEKKNINE